MIRERTPLTVFTFPYDRSMITAAGGQGPVQTVVRDVGRAAYTPLRPLRAVGYIQQAIEWLKEVQPMEFHHRAPKPIRIAGRVFAQILVARDTMQPQKATQLTIAWRFHGRSSSISQTTMRAI